VDIIDNPSHRHPPRVLAIYCALLLTQFVIVRHSAATYGVRFVMTVLALKASAPAVRTPEKRVLKAEKS
jgi:hypothetical protein